MKVELRLRALVPLNEPLQELWQLALLVGAPLAQLATTASETSRDVRSAASNPMTRTGLLYWPSNKSSTTLSMVSSTGGIRHADGGGIGRSTAAAPRLHCTMNI